MLIDIKIIGISNQKGRGQKDRGQKSGAGRWSRTTSNLEHGAAAMQILLTGTKGRLFLSLGL